MAMLVLYIFLCFHLFGIYDGQKDQRRPIWNIAHMVNSVHQITEYLDKGANSIEFDIAFDENGIAEYTYHGIPCDCLRICTYREDLVFFLSMARAITQPGNYLYRPECVLLFLDLKIKHLTRQGLIRAGYDIATKLMKNYWKDWIGRPGGEAYILMSVPSTQQMLFIASFTYTLRNQNCSHHMPKIGFDFSGNEDLGKILQAYELLDIRDQIWLSDGITNCWFRGVSRLEDALYIRDRPKPRRPNFNKVYWWTVDFMSSMRTVLRMGVDGIITNYPENLIAVLNEEEFSNKMRLATYEDNPWTLYHSPN